MLGLWNGNCIPSFINLGRLNISHHILSSSLQSPCYWLNPSTALQVHSTFEFHISCFLCYVCFSCKFWFLVLIQVSAQIFPSPFLK